MCDLDGNGLMSRDEFNWFNLRTSGEDVADDEWDVVEGQTLFYIYIYIYQTSCETWLSVLIISDATA